MAVDNINLRKLLQFFYADNRLRRSLLLADIRNDRRKASGAVESGGDFYGPFWADAKDHVAGLSDITNSVAERIAANKSRARLYPMLRDSFLAMLNEKMRWRNEPFQFAPQSVKARFPVNALEAVVKIENTAAVEIWDGTNRVLYPYFSEKPALPEEGARVGFWVLGKALPNVDPQAFRIVDFHRRAYFRPSELPLLGSEQDIFLKRYDAVLREWRKLQDEE